MSWSSRKLSKGLSRGPSKGLLFAALALVAGCEGNTAAECGPGTEERFGRCVVTAAPEVRCGEGTVLDEESNRCEPLITCGEGTAPNPDTGFCDPEAECGPGTFLDLQTGACVTESECGPGTLADLESGLCLEVLVCGPGTIEQDGRCLPLPFCTEGALLDPETGECTADQSCGAGLVVVNGVCVEEDQAIALEADVVESLPDRNNPATGGAPELLVLEPQGERAVAVGTIDRPASPEGAAEPIQDVDVWRFTGRRGQYLRVQVVSLGLPQPAFVVEGPDGYLRESPLGYERNPMRELILPHDGEYEIAVAPSAFLLSGQAVGAADAEYALVVEERPLPSRLNIPVSLGPSGAEETAGTVVGLDDNFFQLTAPSGLPVIVELDGDFAGNAPALMAFNNNMELLAHVQDAGETGWMGLQVRGDAFIIVDWTRSVTPDGDFTVKPYIPSTVLRGSIPADHNTVTARHASLPGRTGGAFTFRYDDQQVARCEVFGSGVFGPDIQVTGPGGTVARVNDDEEVFFLAEPGDYVLFVFNDSVSDDSDVGLTLRGVTPYDLGALAAGETGPRVQGAPLVEGFSGFEDAWSVVRAPADALVSLDVTAEAGDPRMAVFDVRGRLLRALRRPHLGAPVAVRAASEGPLLVRLEAGGEPLENWSLEATVLADVEELDVEPNDTRAAAVLVGAPPVRLTGVAHDEEADVFRVQLDAPLAPEQALEVRFNNLESDSTFSTITDASEIRIYDASFQPLEVLPSDGVLGVHALAVAPGFAVGDEVFVEVLGKHLPANQPQAYLLEVVISDRAVEVEPNDTPDAADVLPLDGRLTGYLGGGDTVDVARVDLSEDLGPDASLLVELRNLETNNDLELTVRNAAGDVVAFSDRVLGAAAAPALPAGAYFVEVRGTSTTLIYELTARIGARAEVEPNDILPEALTLSGDALTVEGTTLAGDVDRFDISLPAPLAIGTALRVRLINLDDSTDHLLRLVDGHDAGDFERARDESSTGELRARVPAPGVLGLIVEGAGTKADRYRIEVSVDADAELEPNDATSSATPIADLDAPFFAGVTGGEVDFLSFELPAGVSEAVVQMENASDGSSVEMSLSRESGAALGGGIGFRVRQPIQNPTAGRYFIRLVGQQASTDASDLVRIDLEVR